MNKTTDLSRYTPGGYYPGNWLKRILWYFVNVLFFINPLNPSSGLKVLILRLFGAKVGRGVVIKPAVNIKYPWMLQIGNHSWIGERVWIDNLAPVSIGNHCCISQGAMLLCGNHNFKKVTFELMTLPITLEDGSWVGAFAIVGPGVTCGSHSVLAVNSVANRNLEPYAIYQGNPAQKIKQRIIED
ncbi:MAG: colanic acid biosynthesis acetyltransferase WcaF [Bacteroidetes bacterium]|nr:colanic acid biosynthesis acetyltransferase WcaF [Bacteroidota bacterium]